MRRKTETDRPARGGQWKAAAWALLGGGLYALGNIGFGWWPLALVCLIPFWHALEQVRLKGTMSLLRIGLIFGLGIYLCGFQWLTALADQFVSDGILARTLWLIVGLLFALSFGFYALLYAFLQRSGLPCWASAATPWLALEWLQFNLFPAYLGLGLIDQSEIAQLASLGGPLMLSTFALAANLILYRLLKKRSRYALKTMLIQDRSCLEP